MCLMATKHEPGTGNVGVSRLALAQRPSHDWRFADVVRDVTLRVPELRIGTVLTNLAAWGRERLPRPQRSETCQPPTVLRRRWGHGAAWKVETQTLSPAQALVTQPALSDLWFCGCWFIRVTGRCWCPARVHGLT